MWSLALNFIKNPTIMIMLVLVLGNLGLGWYSNSLKEENKNLTESMLITAGKVSELNDKLKLEKEFYDRSLDVIAKQDKEKIVLHDKFNKLRKEINSFSDACLDVPINPDLLKRLQNLSPANNHGD